jgi:glycolate oxidase subunit GlcD
MQRLSAPQRRFLARLFPGDGHSFDPAVCAVHGTDASGLAGPVLAVVRPGETAQLAKLMRWCQEENVCVYPRARATGLVGGCVPTRPGVVVSFSFMDRIKEISAPDFLAVAEPGCPTGRLQAEAGACGLFYAPDPASAAYSTLGGNVMTNAGGMRALKYGVTRDHVLGLEVVLPGGEVVRPGARTRKNVVGLDLVSLLVGSGGVLGLVTEVTVNLLPAPAAHATVLAGFATPRIAVASAEAMFSAGLRPAACEIMARGVLAVLEESGEASWPEGTGCVLLMRLDASSEADLAAQVEGIGRAVREASLCLETGRGEAGEELWRARRTLNQASYRVARGKASADVTVPRGRVAEALEAVEELGAESGLPILAFGHLGDGNLHVNVMFDPADSEAAAMAAQVQNRVFSLSLSLGGVLSGEHGVGLLRSGLAGEQLGPAEQSLMLKVKDLFDPTGILNPGRLY